MTAPYPANATQRRFARVAGLAFLGNYVAGVLGFVGTAGIASAVAFSEAADRAAGSPLMYRASFTSLAISWVILTLQAYALYVTLRPVNAHIATLAGILQGTQAAVGAAGMALGYGVLQVYLAATPAQLTSTQLEGLRSILDASYQAGFNIAMLFFAPASLLFFYLFFKSGYMPRLLAGIGLVGSSLMIISTIAALTQTPGAKMITIAAWVPMGVAEVGTALWLTFAGIRGAEDYR